MERPRGELHLAGCDRRLRRLIGLVAFAGVLAVGVGVLPRLLPRSPLTVLAACVLAVVTMKLVEGRLSRWVRRLGEQEGSGAGRG